MTATQIRGLMAPEPLTLQERATAQEAARLMKEYDVGSILVCDGDELVGIARLHRGDGFSEVGFVLQVHEPVVPPVRVEQQGFPPTQLRRVQQRTPEPAGCVTTPRFA